MTRPHAVLMFTLSLRMDTSHTHSRQNPSRNCFWQFQYCTMYPPNSPSISTSKKWSVIHHLALYFWVPCWIRFTSQWNVQLRLAFTWQGTDCRCQFCFLFSNWSALLRLAFSIQCPALQMPSSILKVSACYACAKSQICTTLPASKELQDHHLRMLSWQLLIAHTQATQLLRDWRWELWSQTCW